MKKLSYDAHNAHYARGASIKPGFKNLVYLFLFSLIAARYHACIITCKYIHNTHVFIYSDIAIHALFLIAACYNSGNSDCAGHKLIIVSLKVITTIANLTKRNQTDHGHKLKPPQYNFFHTPFVFMKLTRPVLLCFKKLFSGEWFLAGCLCDEKVSQTSHICEVFLQLNQSIAVSRIQNDVQLYFTKKQKKFPYRESNPGRLGESQES